MPSWTQERPTGWRGWFSKALWAVPVLIALGGYRLTGVYASGIGRAWVVRLPVDDIIPLVPAFVYVYVFWYLYSYGTILLLMLRRSTVHAYHRYTLSMLLTMMVCLVFFIWFPTTVARPEVGGDTLAPRLLRAIYAIDPPYNCLPSIHVAFSVLTGWELDRMLRADFAAAPAARIVSRVLNLATAVLICLSTLFTKQHFSPDLLAGVAVAVAARLAAQAWLSGRTRQLASQK